MKRKILLTLVIISAAIIGCTGIGKVQDDRQGESKSVAQVLKTPEYDRVIQVYGTIRELGIRESKSFLLESENKSLNAWYGMMVDDKHKPQPDVDIRNFRNSDQVILTGALKDKGRYVLKNHFWIHSIRKK
ncbi:MAG TPA: hypothetical protein PK358_17410 [Spirochaetota bacterium]|nr:hypothetical protein [Spirochaetota bacterium]